MASGPSSLSNLLHANPPARGQPPRRPETIQGLSLTAGTAPAAAGPSSRSSITSPSLQHFRNPSPISPVHRPPLPPLAPPRLPPPSPAAAPGAPAIVDPAGSAAVGVTGTPPNPSPSSSSPSTAAGPASAGGLRSHSNNTSLYQCADCQRRYSRPEHLARHIQTHTLGKRFACHVCGKAFARADLLKRHVANHDNDNDATKKRRRFNAEPGAGRVSHACRPCATARVKCEELKPCTRCRTRNLKCEYASPEAGSAAAMHLLHLSANAYHSSSGTSSPNPSAGLDSKAPIPYQAAGASASASASHAHLQKHPSRVSTQTPLKSPALTQNPTPKTDDTPDTVTEHGNNEQFPPGYEPSSADPVDNAQEPFASFLRDVLYEQQAMDPSRIAEAQGLEVLNFCDNADLELNEMDFGLLDHWNVDGIGTSAMASDYVPGAEDSPVELSQMRQTLSKVWTDSPWRWHPRNIDTGYGEQSNLPVPTGDVTSPVFQESRQRLDRIVKEKLESSGRDRILGIVLSTCRTNNIMTRVASSFPSADVMDTLIHIFLDSHTCQVSGWIHYGTFSLNAQWPEWLAVVAAAGAVLTPIQTLRKFGFALQEAVRVTIPSRFEENNTSIKDLGLVQALILGQDLGLWSGNRRKMEIAECHLLIPVTMMRYRGLFQRSAYPVIIVDPADEGDVLEEKWRIWCERESWKRLVYHCYLRDAQSSMTTLTNPSMSYAELTLPLPEARELWFARSAMEWKMHYLDRDVGQAKRPPCIGDLFRDINMLVTNHRRLDVQFSISIYLHGFWALILEYRQLSTVHRARSYTGNLTGNPNLVLSSRHQEMWRDLQAFQLMTSDWNEALSAQESLMLNLLMLNLHVSLDDLQLFSGKEGEEQARRIYPTLQQWADSNDARQAIWHAGRILRQAKMFPQGHLKDFYAVGVHHAALALWTYGVVSKATRRMPVVAQYGFESIFVDGAETTAVQRFVGFGQGRPMIRGIGQPGMATEAALEDPRATMEIVQEILRANFPHDQELLPPIVENLCGLIRQLGNAAWSVGLG